MYTSYVHYVISLVFRNIIDSVGLVFEPKELISSLQQKQPSKSVLRKRCSENIRQIYRRTPMPKFDFNKVALHLRMTCSASTAAAIYISNVLQWDFHN